MLRYTLVWALRFAPARLLGGVILCLFSIYMIEAAPGAADSEFVAAPYAFGTTPWFVALVAGAMLVLFAWRRGRAARAGG